jgi:hypothetical protein
MTKKPPSTINQATLKKVRKFYVVEGLTPTAITAQMRMELQRVVDIIEQHNLRAERELYLEQNPNLSALAASSSELRRIQNKQQSSQEITASERNFLMKYLEAEGAGLTDQEQFQNWSKEKLDKRIGELHSKLYPAQSSKTAPKSSSKTETDQSGKS